ncbi:MAG: sulfate adenylyltransferase, partial [Stenotrophobium sp.]
MSQLVKPHGGGALKPLLLEGSTRVAELKRAATLPRVNVSSREAGDIIMLGIGGFTPLSGFMNKADWQGVCDQMKMVNGLFWPIPITLSTNQATADGLKTGADVALYDPERNEILATMTVTEKYGIDKAHECQQIFSTTDAAHPGVKMVMEQGEVNLAGPVKVLSQGEFQTQYGEMFMTPAQTRAEFEKRGWKKVA